MSIVDRYLTTAAIVLVPALVAATLFASYLDAAVPVVYSLFGSAALSAIGLLATFFAVSLRSLHSVELNVVRIHLLLHLTPLVFFIALFADVTHLAARLSILVLCVGFFSTGRATWKTMGRLFPGTFLYAFFVRGNTALLISLPVIFSASYLMPDTVSFTAFERMATIYFAAHFVNLGCFFRKFERDLM